jgi:N-acetylglucosaminyldiphosphoundecaprenol N-acetyl-beta-D-mannosaminyltransferase
MQNKWTHRQIREEAIEQTKEELYQRFSDRGLRRRQRRRRRLGMSVPLAILVLSGMKRTLDILAASVLILLLSPLLAVAFLIGGREMRRAPRVGRWCETFDELSFAVPKGDLGRWMTKLRLNSLPVLFNLLKGDLSFIGPRLVSPGDLSPRQRAARKRFSVRPGLVCLWWVRRRANIAFDNEVDSDSEYVDTQTVWGDLGIALRTIPAVIYGEGVQAVAGVVRILNIHIHNLTMSEAVEAILARLQGNRPSQVCFVNADCANLSCNDAEYLGILNHADLTLADGIGLKLAGKLLARDIKQNVNGTDLFPRLCVALSGTGQGVFLLGAKPGVAERVRDWIQQTHPGVIVSGCHDGYFSPLEEPEVIRQIAGSGASLLLVAFGAPRQDKWISTHLGETGVKVAMGVGGLFDFYSGSVTRAPQWIREIGLEWVYRFLQEPGRMWKRYFLGNALFLFRVFKDRNRQPLPVA